MSVRMEKGERLKTPIGRASFVNVFTPVSSNLNNSEDGDSKKKYQITLLFDKKAQQTPAYKALRREVKKCMKKLWGDRVPKGWKNPWKSGEALQDAKGNWYNGCDEETIAIRAISSGDYQAPEVVNRNLSPITDEKDFYAGCYAIATLVPSALDMPTNKCCPFYLQNVMKIKDGEHLGGRVSAKKEFEEVNWDDYGDLDDFEEDPDEFEDDDEDTSDDGDEFDEFDDDPADVADD